MPREAPKTGAYFRNIDKIQTRKGHEKTICKSKCVQIMAWSPRQTGKLAPTPDIWFWCSMSRVKVGFAIAIGYQIMAAYISFVSRNCDWNRTYGTVPCWGSLWKTTVRYCAKYLIHWANNTKNNVDPSRKIIKIIAHQHKKLDFKMLWTTQSVIRVCMKNGM